jgi:DNA-binding winged helix-turn-helix (wHTH) protein
VKAESEQEVQHTVYLFDGFQLDVTRHQLISSGGLVQPLNSRAMEALLLLVRSAGELVEKRRLMQTVWPNAIVEDNNLNQCILAIRKALGETAGSNRYIMTVPGRGYRFVSPVRTITQESLSEVALASTPRQRVLPYARWLAGAAAACALLLVVLLTRMGEKTEDSLLAAVDVTTAQDRSSPGIVLRLHEPAAVSGTDAASSSTTLLARCLAARPNMKLRVQVQLVGDGGSAVWTGDYVAGAQDLLALQVGGNATALGCRELIASVRNSQAASPH